MMARLCILQIASKWGCAFVDVNQYQWLRAQAKLSPRKLQSRDPILFSFYLCELALLGAGAANAYTRGNMEAV